MTVQIPVGRKQFALIDDEYVYLVQSFLWYLSDGYAVRRLGPRRKGERQLIQSMHRLLYESVVGPIPEKMQIDHIDGNRLNNQMGNLRIVTNRENSQNKRVHREGTTKSGLLGVRPAWKNSKKWMATIRIGKREHFLGSFDDKYEAHRAYMDACAKLDEHRNGA